MSTVSHTSLLKALADIRRIASTNPRNNPVTPLTIDKAVIEWKSKKRRMGCVAAAEWFCARVDGFWPEELSKYTASGDYFGHVVATDGVIRIDLAPYADKPRND